MIAKGNPHNDGPYLARYLAADSKGNESAELAELRGFATDNVFDAFALGQLMAEGTRCEKPFFHVAVRLPKDEELSREQWQKVADRVERQLGFDDQPRAVIFHQKAGQEHMHLVFSRIDPNDLRAIDPGLYKRKLKEICRKLEKEMGLQQVKNDRDPDEKTQPAARPEFEQSRRLQTDLKAIREDIRDCWDRSDNGRSFVAALNEKGFVFARGDRRDFVIVDQKGGDHALAKRITSATAGEARARLSDIDKESLPSVAQAKALQRERNPHAEDKKAMSDEGAIGKEEEQIRTEEEKRQEAITQAEELKSLEINQQEERKTEAIADQEQQKEKAVKEAGEKDEERLRSQFKEQADRQVEQAREMELQEKQLDAYKAELSRMAEEGRREEAQRLQAEREGQAQELAIRNPNYRYGQALAQHYDVKDPYGSLARSAMGEYGAFLRDRETLDRQIAQAKDPEARRALELRKGIESAEYMAITSDRIAVQSEIIVGRRDTEEAGKYRKRAVAFRKEAHDLRVQFRELQVERAQGTDTPAARGTSQNVAEPKPQQKETELKAGRDREGQEEPAFGTEKGNRASMQEIDFDNVRKTWQEKTSTPAFAEALKEQGYILAHDEKGRYDFTVEKDGGARLAVVAQNGYAYRLDPERMQSEPDVFTQRAKELKSGTALPSVDEARATQEQRRAGRAAPSVEGRQPRGKEIVEEPKQKSQQRENVPALMVEERTPGKPRGKPEKLGDFINTTSLPEKPPQRAFTADEISRDRKARNAHYAQLVSEQQRGAALNRIGEDMKAGRNLSASDVKNLSRDDLEKIKTKGDDQLKQIVQEHHERQRTKERER